MVKDNLTIPDGETIYRDYFDRFNSIRKTFLSSYNISQQLELDHISIASFYYLILFIILIPFIIFIALPLAGIQYTLAMKLLIAFILAIIFFILLLIIDGYTQQPIAEVFRNIAEMFIKEAMGEGKNTYISLAILKIWTEKNNKERFSKIILPNINKFIKKNNLQMGQILRYHKEILILLQEYDRQLLEKRKKEEEELKKAGEIRLKNKDEIRIRLRKMAYGKKYETECDRSFFDSEISNLEKGLSSFRLIYPRCNNPDRDSGPVDGDLYMAVSPEYIFLILRKNDINLGSSLSDLIKAKNIFLIIIPPAFLYSVRGGFFTQEGSAKGNFGMIFKKPLGIRMNYVYDKKLRGRDHLITKERVHLKSFGIMLKKSVENEFRPILEKLEKKLGLNPQCPICYAKYDIYEHDTGFTCDNCNINYRWGFDFLQRITIIPTMDNEINAYKESWQL